MDLLAQYASDDSDADPAPKAPTSRLPGVADLLQQLYVDSPYFHENERRRAEEGKERSFVRSFPHQRGNWPAYVYLPVPETDAIKELCIESMAHLEARLARAAGRRPFKRRRTKPKRGGVGGGAAATTAASNAADEQRKPQLQQRRGDSNNNGSNSGGGNSGGIGGSNGGIGDGDSSRGSSSGGIAAPPRLVPSASLANFSGHHHLSLSRTAVLQHHHIEAFAADLGCALNGVRRFAVVVSGSYDVLVNEERTRSFQALRVVGGTEAVVGLIRRVDSVVAAYKQPLYHQEPIPHVSVASCLGDVSELLSAHCVGSDKDPHIDGNLGASSSNAEGDGAGSKRVGCQDAGKGDTSGNGRGGGKSGEQTGDGGGSSSDEYVSEVTVPVTSVVCRVAHHVFNIPLLES